MNTRNIFSFLLLATIILNGSCMAGNTAENWRLATQAYSFNKFTFYEAVDKTASLGLNCIEAYPGQILSKEKPDVKFGCDMPAEIRQEVKNKLQSTGVTLINYGVADLPNDPNKCRKVFEFAKDMGIETIVSEPKEESLEMIDKLCAEYKIKVAIHNHPKPSHYWDPNTILAACRGRSNWIGACADTGHWMRSGVNPLDALKKLQGRIVSLHFKDLNEFGNPKAHDVVWGTGKADVNSLLTELARQNFKGVFSIEYEYNWDNSVPQIRQCVEYFSRMALELGQTKWRDLLAKDLSNCTFKPGAWTYEDGVLTRNGGGNIWTKDKYGDFVLDLEFKVSEAANSGVFLRCGDLNDWINTTIEVQIHETGDGTRHGQCGAIYDCLSPSKDAAKKAGKWNHYIITCKANKITVVLNGEQIIDMDLNQWTEPHKNPDGTPNKFKYAYKDMPRVGLIGLQDHGKPVWFRNIRIKPLE